MNEESLLRWVRRMIQEEIDRADQVATAGPVSQVQNSAHYAQGLRAGLSHVDSALVVHRLRQADDAAKEQFLTMLAHVWGCSNAPYECEDPLHDVATKVVSTFRDQREGDAPLAP